MPRREKGQDAQRPSSVPRADFPLKNWAKTRAEIDRLLAHLTQTPDQGGQLELWVMVVPRLDRRFMTVAAVYMAPDDHESPQATQLVQLSERRADQLLQRELRSRTISGLGHTATSPRR
jgi:outer membrane receptor for ferric coprogen and ferric-rhodotorulic acid